jgi:hypothetical protein
MCRCKRFRGSVAAEREISSPLRSTVTETALANSSWCSDLDTIAFQFSATTTIAHSDTTIAADFQTVEVNQFEGFGGSSVISITAASSCNLAPLR